MVPREVMWVKQTKPVFRCCGLLTENCLPTFWMEVDGDVLDAPSVRWTLVSKVILGMVCMWNKISNSKTAKLSLLKQLSNIRLEYDLQFVKNLTENEALEYREKVELEIACFAIVRVYI